MIARPRSRTLWLAGTALLMAAAALVDVSLMDPRVHVRWADGISEPQRVELERRYGLAAGERVAAATWRYELRDTSRGNLGALIADRSVADTAYIDRPALQAPSRQIDITFARLRFLVGPSPSGLIQIQSLMLVVLAVVMLRAAALTDARRRRAVAVAVLLAAGLAALTVQLWQPIRMGDSETYVKSRESFEMYSGVRQIRFEAHLSHAVLGRLDALFGASTASPERALRTLVRASTIWFVLMALCVGAIEGWSDVALRYLALVLAAPVTLMYFGYLELGQLSLNLAAFPLLTRGIRQLTPHLEAGSVLAGLGAALHGFGLVSVGGAILAALGGRTALRGRLMRALRVVAWCTAAYLGWIAIYLTVLKLPVVPGHAESIPFRPWLADEIGERLNPAILSRLGMRDLVFSVWVVGAPLVAIAWSLRRRFGDEVRVALLYAVPSLIFLVMFWPIQGLAVEMDLVLAAFPAIYALAWVCAHDARHTAAAAVVLASAHLAFWRVVLDPAFVNSRL